jgi:putative addiction module CopG family antidote
MTLSLPPDLQRFVHDQIARGHFPSADGVIEAGLRLLCDREAELRSLLRWALAVASYGHERWT